MNTPGRKAGRPYAGDIFFLLTLALIISFAGSGQASAEPGSNLLLTVPPILAAHSSSPPGSGEPLTLRVYVAGESIEELNHFNNQPFNTDGSLNNLGQNNNTPNEYGWMVPFAARLNIRDPNLDVKWVGSGCWTDQYTWECSTGSLTNTAIGHTSAQSGSTVAEWITDHNSELTGKQYCYDVAFASRGGNDLMNGVANATYRNQLRSLILGLDKGSSCRTHPLIYVTAHMVDVAAWDYGISQTAINSWLDTQRAYYVTIAQDLVAELSSQYPVMHIRFVDMWSPFVDNRKTTAFPAENWQVCGNASQPTLCWPDTDKIHHPDGQHPKRLASIYAGENAADQVNITELRTIFGTK